MVTQHCIQTTDPVMLLTTWSLVLRGSYATKHMLGQCKGYRPKNMKLQQWAPSHPKTRTSLRMHIYLKYKNQNDTSVIIHAPKFSPKRNHIHLKPNKYYCHKIAYKKKILIFLININIKSSCLRKQWHW